MKPTAVVVQQKWVPHQAVQPHHFFDAGYAEPTKAVEVDEGGVDAPSACACRMFR